MTSFYVATASANVDNAEWWIDQIKKYGHTITYDWTPMVREHGRGEAGKTDLQILLNGAVSDARGAQECDVLFLLWHKDLYGALLETGIAIAKGNAVWVVGPQGSVKYSIFWELSNVRLYTPMQARNALQEL